MKFLLKHLKYDPSDWSKDAVAWRYRMVFWITLLAALCGVVDVILIGSGITNDENSQVLLAFILILSGSLFLAGLFALLIIWLAAKINGRLNQQ